MALLLGTFEYVEKQQRGYADEIRECGGSQDKEVNAYGKYSIAIFNALTEGVQQ